MIKVSYTACLLLALVGVHLAAESGACAWARPCGVIPEGKVMSCGDVVTNMGSCIFYVVGSDGKPSESCCDGCRRLKAMARSARDRRKVCRCLKAAADHIYGLVDDNVGMLPVLCNITLPHPFRRDVDCDSVP